MKEAYFKRWQIEIGYDILKNKLLIENFTGKTQITIEQDFYAQIYTFNVLQDIKHEATQKVKEKNKYKDLKYKYKPNINILAGWLKNLVIVAIFANTHEKRKELFNILEEKVEKNLIEINPNRKYKRNKKSIYFKLTALARPPTKLYILEFLHYIILQQYYKIQKFIKSP